MKVVFMGTPLFAVPTLEKLIANQYDIELVVTQPDKPVGRKQVLTPPPIKEVALKNSIEVVQPDKLRNNIDIINKLKLINPDVIVVVAYGKILPKEILDIPKYGCINVHASLLPKYRGAAPIHRCIIDNLKQTGITIMKMDEGLDTGDILSQCSVEITMDDDIQTLSDKLSKCGADLLIETLKNIENIKPQKQDSSIATYAPPISKIEGLIDWTNSVKEIFNKYRALKYWPGLYTYFNGKILKVHNIEVHNNLNSSSNFGEIVSIENDGLYVKASDGLIKIIELQIEGSKKMDAKSFINGYKIKVGDKLG
ncbi:methionyl-tRNA formyltransferase [Caldicellulosiruptoraceae bacterium PP1]